MRRRRTIIAVFLALAASAVTALTTAQPAAASGPVVLRNFSGLCAQPSVAGTGFQLVLATCDPTVGSPNWTAQHWTTEIVSGSRYKLVNFATGGCMDAHGPFSPGTVIDTFGCSGISNQVWVDGPAASGFPSFAQIKVNAAQGQCLASNLYGVVGTGLSLRNCAPANTDFKQYWYIGIG